MIIGTCGFCSTGSSAVSDYLREFEENQVIDNLEWTLTYLPDGLEDLEYHLTRNINRDDSCGIAIPRFRRLMQYYFEKQIPLPRDEARGITESFLNEIIQMRWKSSRRTDCLLYPTWFYRTIGHRLLKKKILPYLKRNLKKDILIYPNRMVDISISPCNFTEASRNFIKQILLSFGADFSKNIVLDQPFIGNNPEKSFHFYDNPVAIVVDRDPRDHYIFSKEILSKKSRFFPSDNVYDYVKYYRLIRANQPYKMSNERILCMNFEEMVYDYDNTTRKIRDFCHLPENQRPFTVFDPKLSIANTQLVEKFPQYKKDIEYIERELPEYLFDFDKFPKPDNSGRMFMGKSPLNKKKDCL